MHGGLLVEPVAGAGCCRDSNLVELQGTGGVAWAEWKVVAADGAVVRSRPSDAAGEVGRLRPFETVVGMLGTDGWVGVAVAKGGKEVVGWVRVAAGGGMTARTGRSVLMRLGRSLA